MSSKILTHTTEMVQLLHSLHLILVIDISLESAKIINVSRLKSRQIDIVSSSSLIVIKNCVFR